MSDWTSGYVADIGYTYGYYAMLNPLRLRMAFLNTGLAFPEIATACELGFGQGMSVNIHAAASSTQWYATDFNPSQAVFARQLAQEAGAGAKLYDQSFEEFCRREDLPDFDYIALHGIWSWISERNRQVIVDFIRRKLRVGGVLYISYNTLPGWSSVAPLRHLLSEYTEHMAARGQGILSRINASMGFAEKLFATDPMYIRAHPSAVRHFDGMKKHDQQYLAHEYFNRDWHPMYFAEMAAHLQTAKLSYACSTHLPDHVDALNVSSEQLALLAEIPDPLLQQTLRDYMTNQPFRREYWVKGPCKLSVLDQVEGVRNQRVMLLKPRQDVQLKIKGVLGEADLAESIYSPVLDELADLKPRTLGQLETQLSVRNIGLAQITQAVLILLGKGDLDVVQEDRHIDKAKTTADKINMALMQKSRSREDIAVLASPMTGGGVSVDRLEQLFLLAMVQGRKQPQEWVSMVWELFAVQGQRVLKDGLLLETAAENLAELHALAGSFASKRLPILKALRIV